MYDIQQWVSGTWHNVGSFPDADEAMDFCLDCLKITRRIRLRIIDPTADLLLWDSAEEEEGAS